MNDEKDFTQEELNMMVEQDKRKRAETFGNELNALCEKHSCTLQAVPEFIQRDDGSFAVITRISVVAV